MLLLVCFSDSSIFFIGGLKHRIQHMMVTSNKVDNFDNHLEYL